MVVNHDIDITHLPIGDLRPDPANPRRISDDELESLTRSIREFGLIDPIIARREDKVVIGEHQRLLESLPLGKPDSSDDERFRRRVKGWKGLTLGFLTEVYILRSAIDTINQRYFDGQQSLFPGVAEGFSELLALMEKTVGIYNDSLAGEIERLECLLNETGHRQDESPLSIDLAGLIENVQVAAQAQVAYLVDMAKAEALDLLGETRQAFKLVDRHA